MIKILEYQDMIHDPKQKEKILVRASFEDKEAMQIAEKIIYEIQEGKKEALLKITRKLDHYSPEPLVLTPKDFQISEELLSEEEKKAFQDAAHNIRLFHEFQKKNLQEAKISYSEATLGYLYRPIDYAAVYVPGGKAIYPSSVLMGVIPAKIAGVKHITVITPANEKGEIHPSVLYCSKLAGADAILKVGGAHGIAAAFFGIDVPPAQIIVGPGNRYVTAAKNILASTGKVKIDQPAGPSEILIIADRESDPKLIAADLLSQAEHGEDSVCILLTDSMVLAEKVDKEIEKELIKNPKRLDFKEKSIRENSYIIVFNDFVRDNPMNQTKELTDNFYKAFQFINEFAPEHLEICLNIFDEPEEYLQYVESAGSVFIGKYAPVALGDYFSGTNHILPTGGSAKIFAGLGVDTFLKRITWQYTTKEGLKKALNPIMIMSTIEDLEQGHGYSVKIRFE